MPVGIMWSMTDNHVCLLCGELIERTSVDPRSVALAASWRDAEVDNVPSRRVRASPPWWDRPPGPYRAHAVHLRGAAQPPVPIQILDLAEDAQGPSSGSRR
jgi:hypothetical protein